MSAWPHLTHVDAHEHASAMHLDTNDIVHRIDMVDAPMPSIFLTFDDGPDPEWTPRVLDMLAAAEVRATFFMLGSAVRRAPALARRVRAAGHEIGNHGFSHVHARWQNDAMARQDYLDGYACIAEVTGEVPRLFRPPHGVLHEATRETALSLGHVVVQWSVSAVDWGPLARPQWILRRLLRVVAGDIVLMHDATQRRNHPAQLLQILPAWLAQLDACELHCATLDWVSLRSRRRHPTHGSQPYSRTAQA